MLAYAASRPVVVDRRPRPNTLLFIIGAHVAVVAVVMSAKMDLPRRFKPEPPLIVDTINDPPPPPLNVSTIKPVMQHPVMPTVDHLQPKISLPPVDHGVDLLQPPKLGDNLIGGGGSSSVIPEIRQPPVAPAKVGPRLLTPPSELKPPYPADKLLNEEEGAVTVRLTIDPAGRVIGVDPVGGADPEFLDATRSYVIAHWRFSPATEDGHAIVSTTVVTLHFELNS